jgi:hypothetical protein
MGRRPPAEDAAAPPIISASSWVDYWIDNTNNYCAFFGCDEDSCTGVAATLRAAGTASCVGGGGGGVSSSSYRLAPLDDDDDSPRLDFAALHDAFLDSLLHEQQQQQQKIDRSLASQGSYNNEEESHSELGLNRSASTDSIAHSWTLSPTSSNSSVSDCGGGGGAIALSRKRRRPLLMSHHRPDSLRGIKFPTVVTTTTTTATSTVSSSLFAETKVSDESIRPPESFIHSAVRLQKDKGKGEEVGSMICAKGMTACLGKLREKMQLLTEHCHPGTPATMKRRNAVVSELFDNFVETRSLLSLRMGFLSITYGILLRWDAGKTGLATIVVLRKNCHESFYQKRSFCVTTPSLELSPSTSMDENDGESDLQPPFVIPRPAHFPPAEINVSVLFATGLNKKSHWTVQLQLADQTENILLTYDGNLMVPKLGGPLHYTLPNSPKKATTSSAVLEIRLLEHKVRRKTRVLRCSMVLPLHSLEATSSEASEQPTSMRVPCPDGATIQIEAMLVSDEVVWQRREMSARRSPKQQQHAAKAAARNRRSPDTVMHQVESEDDASSPWDWICNVC